MDESQFILIILSALKASVYWVTSFMTGCFFSCRSISLHIVSAHHELGPYIVAWTKMASGRINSDFERWQIDVKAFHIISVCLFFYLQACVVPLWRLLVREKCDERGSHGIYIISQKHSEPEMYELVCRCRGERDILITVLSQAIDNCPEGGGG